MKNREMGITLNDVWGDVPLTLSLFVSRSLCRSLFFTPIAHGDKTQEHFTVAIFNCISVLNVKLHHNMCLQQNKLIM